ncbi:MAG: flagellar biosynthesis protein FlhB [Alphaproteobacteria bacterium]|nr:flagellar biosynthesis protein FlhB [Alphaproteobacteria bacterium]
MAEGGDDAEKTEDPTSKRLSDARSKGDIAKSAELSGWFVLLAATLLLVWASGPLGSEIARLCRDFLARAHEMPVEGSALRGLYAGLMKDLLLALALPFAVLVAAGVLGNLVQQPPMLTGEKIKPKLEKISPLAGLKRLFGLQAVINLVKGIAKLLIVGAMTIFVLWPERHMLYIAPHLAPGALLDLARKEAFQLLVGVLVVVSVVVLIDIVYQRHSHWQKMRMSRREVKDEHRQAEGDPHVKARLRQIRAERSRQRMMQAVPEATVVIANPTHYAVALKYEQGKMNAPVCVAKGVDALALRIRALAEEHKVPVIENPPLARALHASVELDREVPPEHYRAVAQVIGYVMRVRAKSGKRAR